MRQEQNNMQRVPLSIGIVIVCLTSAFVLLMVTNSIGTSQNHIQEQARKKQNIPDDGYVVEQVTDTLSAMLFYNEDATEHTFSLYINKTGLPFGYFFCKGGIDASIQSSVREFNAKGAGEKVYISMNSRKANSVIISNTIEITKEEIDPDKPFVLVINELSLVEFFDADGNSVYE